MIQKILQMFASSNAKLAPQREIARHLARNYIYEREGIDALFPDFAGKLRRLIEKMDERGKPVYMFSGYRSWKEQNDLEAVVW